MLRYSIAALPRKGLKDFFLFKIPLGQQNTVSRTKSLSTLAQVSVSSVFAALFGVYNITPPNPHEI